MPGKSPLIERDLLLSFASLRRRVRNLLDGATPMPFYVGAYGLNTFWTNLRPLSGWHMVGGAHVQVRVRSDVIYLRTTTRSGGVAPVTVKGGWPAGPAFQLPGKPNVLWPSYRVITYCLTAIHTVSVMTVTPNGHIYLSKPPRGRTLRPGSASWPRG